jgi:predicted DNA-binding protein (MmcQ/YjbR family)
LGTIKVVAEPGSGSPLRPVVDLRAMIDVENVDNVLALVGPVNDAIGAEQLRARNPAITPAPYFDKQHWNAVTVDGSLPDAFVRELITTSYELVTANTRRSTT